MQNEAFNSIFEQAQSAMGPVVKANKLAVSNFEKLVSFQMAAVQGYVDMGLKQLKSAVEVSSIEDLQNLMNTQVEYLASLRQKMLDDAKAIADLGNGFKADFDKLAEENVSEISDKASKVTGRATAAARKTTSAAA